jgi:hypothetical protein
VLFKLTGEFSGFPGAAEHLGDFGFRHGTMLREMLKDSSNSRVGQVGEP